MCSIFPLFSLHFFPLPFLPSPLTSPHSNLPFLLSPLTSPTPSFLPFLPFPSPPTSPPPPTPLAANAPRVYSTYMNRVSRFLEPILRCVMFVGQTQLIRRQICRELGSSSKYDSKLLFNTLQAFNQ